MATIERHNKVQYYLQSREFGTIKIQPPRGWENDFKNIEKDKDSKGFTVKNEIGLEFFGDASDYLLQGLKSFGVQIKTSLIKYEKDKRSKHQSMKLAYILEIDMSSIDYDEKTKMLKCKAIEGGLYTDIQDRVSEEYDMFDQFSADGLPIGPLKTVSFQPKQRSLFLESKLESRNGSNYILKSGRWSSVISDFYFGIPMDIKYSSHPDDVTTVSYAIESSKGHSLNNTIGTKQRVTDQFFFLAERDLQIDVRLKLDFEIENIYYNDAKNPRNFSVQLRRSQGDDIQLSEIITVVNYGDFFGIKNQRKQIDYSTTIDVKEGESLAFVFYAQVNASGGGSNNRADLDIKIYSGSLVIEDDTPFEQSVGEAVVMFDVMERLLAKMTGKQNMFRSSVLGPGGKYADIVCDNGYLCRGFPKSRQEDGETIKIQMVASWEDAFKSLSYIEPMAWWVEIEGDKQVVRLETAKQTMENFIGIDLGEVDELNIKASANDFFSKVIIGMDKSIEYEEVNGTREFNGKTELATPIGRGKQIYEAITPFRIDSVGYETVRRKQFKDYSSEDTSRDEDIWMHWAKKTASGYTHKLWADDFDEPPRGVFSPETTWNIYFSPFNRAIYGHGYSINRCMYYFPQKLLKFNSSNSNANMLTKTGGVTLEENGSVKVSTIEQPLIEPLAYILNVKLTQSIMDDIDGSTEINGRFVPNYFGLVKFVYRNKNYFGRFTKIETDEQTKIELISSHANG